jgi:hypothetical protein
MVISASQSSSLIIEQHHLEFSEKMVTALELDMPQVFERIGQNDQTRGMGELVDIVRRNNKMTQSELYRTLFRTMSYQDFELALKSAIAARHISLSREPNNPDPIITANR